MQNLPDAPHLLGLYTVFILLFVTLGPVKLLGPFTQLTRDADQAIIGSIAMRAFVLSVIAVVGHLQGATLESNSDDDATAPKRDA